MMVRAVVLATAIILCTAAAPSAGKPPQQRWTLRYDAHVDRVNGETPDKPQVVRGSDSSCIDAFDTADMGKTLTSLTMDECRFDRIEAGLGKIAIKGRCNFDRDAPPVEVDANGTYDDAHLSVLVHFRGKADGDDVEASGMVQGALTGICR